MDWLSIIVYGLMILIPLINIVLHNKYLNFLYMIYLFFIITYRYNVGGDWERYNRYWLDYDSHMETIYVFIYRFGYSVGYNFIFEFFSIIILFCIIVLQKQYPNQRYEIMFYIVVSPFLFTFLNISRQMVSVIVSLTSLKYLSERKIIKYYVGNFIAILFHSSTIIFIAIPFIVGVMRKYNYGKYILLLIPFAFTLRFVFGDILYNIILNVPFLEKFAYHLIDSELNESSLMTYLMLLIYIAILLVVITDRNIYKHIRHNVSFMIFCIGVIFNLMIPGFTARIILGLLYSIILWMPFLISKIKGRKSITRIKVTAINAVMFFILIAKLCANVWYVLPFKFR